MTFETGTLVKARGREWVVLPGSNESLLKLRPLGGGDDEIAGVVTTLEKVESAQFSLPDPQLVGDFHSAGLLRDALRLSSRASAGPFRSLSRIAVQPRPYQLVPLFMALRQETIRLMISDDVGVGKTIEASLIARELLDRGEIKSIGVLCPPHLASNWKKELVENFHLPAELVLSNTAARLERDYRVGHDQSLFEVCPVTVVSMDFIKSDRRRDEFTRRPPDLVIVDEAHTCANSVEQRGARQQRFKVLDALSKRPSQHIVLVTATPHNGNTTAFSSLVGLLDGSLANLPEDLTGKSNENLRRKLAACFVQRRRADIEHFMGKETPFPKRDESDPEKTYVLSKPYRLFFDHVMRLVTGLVSGEGTDKRVQRVRWWSALALLRSVSSSPQAAIATLLSRTASEEGIDVSEVDEIMRKQVFDLDSGDGDTDYDIAPGATGEEADLKPFSKRMLDLAHEAEGLAGSEDNKYLGLKETITKMIQEGYRPIVFCRFISTAEYVAKRLREDFRNSDIACVTGSIPASDRESEVFKLQRDKNPILVATECLSEGINLQSLFDAVIHYDLPWNPTRLEQREGRVDRFNQSSEKVKIVTLYGRDNPVDGIILEILVKKHRAIRTATGVSVPIPMGNDEVLEAIFEGLALRQQKVGENSQLTLPELDQILAPKKEDWYARWDASADREKRSRTMYSQEGLAKRVDEIRPEIEEASRAIGTPLDIKNFVQKSFKSLDATVAENGKVTVIDMDRSPRALKDMIGDPFIRNGVFELPFIKDQEFWTRTHPLVSRLSEYVLESSIDSAFDNAIARRCGAITTSSVKTRTTLILARFRYDLITTIQKQDRPQIVEETRLLGFEGSPDDPKWIDEKLLENLLLAVPKGNLSEERKKASVKLMIDGFAGWKGQLDISAKAFAEQALISHKKVREAAQLKNVVYRIDPKLPADVLGVYVYLPVVS